MKMFTLNIFHRDIFKFLCKKLCLVKIVIIVAKIWQITLSKYFRYAYAL